MAFDQTNIRKTMHDRPPAVVGRRLRLFLAALLFMMLLLPLVWQTTAAVEARYVLKRQVGFTVRIPAADGS